MTRRLCGFAGQTCGYLPHTVLNLITSINHQPSRRTKEKHQQRRVATRHTQQTQANEMHVRHRKQKQATKTKARLDTGKQEQANNTDIGYGQTRHEQRGAAARAAAIGQPQLQFKFIGNADHGGMIIGRRDGL